MNLINKFKPYKIKAGLTMAKFLQLPINDKLEKEDFIIDYSGDNANKSYRLNPIEYLKRDTTLKEVFANELIVEHLKIIFTHFEIENNIVDDLIYLSIFWTNQYMNYNPTQEDIELDKKHKYYKAFRQLINNPIFKKYPKIYDAIKSIKEVQTIYKDLLENQEKEKENLKNTRSPKHPTKFNFDRITNHLTKVIWGEIVTLIIYFGIDGKKARKIVVYILGYFQLIHRKHFENKTTFNNFYNKSFYQTAFKEELENRG